MTARQLMKLLNPFENDRRRVVLYIDTDCGAMQADPTDVQATEDAIYLASDWDKRVTSKQQHDGGLGRK